MRKLLLTAALLAVGAFSLHGALAQQSQQTQQEGSGNEMQVTGTVTDVDDQDHVITIDGKEFNIAEQAGTAVLPAVGDKVTLFYEEKGDQNMVTRIGQPQQ